MSEEKDDNKIVYKSGVGVSTLLGVLFVGLKLTGYITWPWVWVVAPFWIPWAVILGILLVGLLGMGVAILAAVIIAKIRD
jgi:hypothetical protein